MGCANPQNSPKRKAAGAPGASQRAVERCSREKWADGKEDSIGGGWGRQFLATEKKELFQARCLPWGRQGSYANDLILGGWRGLMGHDLIGADQKAPEGLLKDHISGLG